MAGYNDRDLQFLGKLKDKWYDFDKSIGLLNEAKQRSVSTPTDTTAPVAPTPTTPTLPKPSAPAQAPEQGRVDPLSFKGFYEYWIKPSAKQFKEKALWIWEKTAEIAKWGLWRIKEAGVWLAEGKYTAPEAFARWGAWAIQTALSPLWGVIWEGIETTVEMIPEDIRADIAENVAPTVKGVTKWYNDQSPEQRRNLDNIWVWFELLLEFVWSGQISRTWKKTLKELGKQAVKDIPAPWVVKGDFIWPIAPTKPSKLTQVTEWITERIQKWDVEFKGLPWKEPTITPIVPKKPKIVKWVDIEKSDDLIRRGLKPSVAGKTTEFAYQKVNTDLREGIEYVSKSKWVARDGVDAMRKTADRKKEIYKTIENNNELVKIKTNIDDIEVNLNKFLDTPEGKSFAAAHPWMRSKISSIVDNWRTEYGTEMTQKQMQLLKQEFNKTLAKGDFAKMMQWPDMKAMADAKISQTLWNMLDDNVMKVLGTTNKALNKEYGAVRNLEKTLAKRMWVFSRNTKWGLTWLTDIFNLWDIVMWTLTWDIKQAGKWLVWKVIAETFKRGENPNRIIKELFQLHWKPKPTFWQKLWKITWTEGVETKLTPKGLKRK